MENYKVQKVFGQISSTNLTAIDTHTPEECLSLQVILGAFDIASQMIGQFESGKPLVKFYANIFPDDKEQIEKDVQKFVRGGQCKQYWGKKYEQVIKQQIVMFDEIRTQYQEHLN